MPGEDRRRSWKWLAAFAVAVGFLVVAGLQIAHGLSQEQEHCDLMVPGGSRPCSNAP